jgi:hypothetical protein
METESLQTERVRTVCGSAYVLPVLFVQQRPTDSNTQLFGDRKSGNGHSIVELTCRVNDMDKPLARSRVRTISKESG